MQSKQFTNTASPSPEVRQGSTRFAPAPGCEPTRSAGITLSSVRGSTPDPELPQQKLDPFRAVPHGPLGPDNQNEEQVRSLQEKTQEGSCRCLPFQISGLCAWFVGNNNSLISRTAARTISTNPQKDGLRQAEVIGSLDHCIPEGNSELQFHPQAFQAHAPPDHAPCYIWNLT